MSRRREIRERIVNRRRQIDTSDVLGNDVESSAYFLYIPWITFMNDRYRKSRPSDSSCSTQNRKTPSSFSRLLTKCAAFRRRSSLVDFR